MRVIEKKVYTIAEHPNKENCYNWIRDNWHDLNEHHVDEIISSKDGVNLFASLMN